MIVHAKMDFHESSKIRTVSESLNHAKEGFDELILCFLIKFGLKSFSIISVEVFCCSITGFSYKRLSFKGTLKPA